MPTRLHNIFRKRSTTAPKKVKPVISPPAPSTSASPPPVEQSTGKLAPTEILKNTILFASGIASNAGIPWVKVVSESIIQIIRRIDTMKLNEEASRNLDNDVKAFLYIVARNGGRNPDDEIVLQFKERVQSILAGVPTTRNSFLRFLNVEETRDIIARVRQNLDSAVQLLQTGLQIALVDAMDEFKEWRAGIENSNSGNVVKKLLNQTYNAKGDLKVKTEGPGTVSFTVQDSKFNTQKSFNQYTRAANITEVLENNIVDADGDIDITTIATGIRDFQ